MKKKFSAFYAVLIVIVILTVIATEVGKVYLKDLLVDYEDSQYKYVAEDFFENNFASGDAKTLAELFGAQIPRFETADRFEKFLSGITEGKELKLQLTTVGLNEDKVYNVICDDVKFATFTLEKTEEKSKYNFDLYRPSEVVFNENLFESYSIEVPLDYTVNVNGFTTDSSYSNGDRIPTSSHEFMPDGVEGITYTTYAFENLCGTPEFTVLSKDGESCNISESEDGVFRADIAYDAKLEAEFADYVIEATKAYACYMQKDANFGKIGKYMDPSSQLYKNIKTSPNWMVITHDSYDFENAVASEFFAYSEDVFSCRVKVVHVLKYRRLEDFRDTIDMTWYLRKVDGKYLIYNSYTN